MARLPCDALALGLTAISSLVFFAKQELPLLADGAPAGTDRDALSTPGGSIDSSIDGSAAAAGQGTLLLAAAAAATLLLALSFTPKWLRWRRWAVPALRLALFPALPWQPQLSAAPGSFAVDAMRVFQGSKTFRLLFFGIGLPLDLATHLAVHTSCLALALADAPRACTLPVLTAPQPASRIAAAHLVIGTLGTGGLLRYFPPNGGQVQCVAALNTFCIFLGWLVPTYFALRRHHEAARHRRLQRQEQQQQESLAREMAPAPAGLVQPSETPGGLYGSGGNRVTRWLLPTGNRLQPPSADAAAAWVLDNLFLHNALLPENAVLAWWVLAALCWIAGGLLALLTTH